LGPKNFGGFFGGGFTVFTNVAQYFKNPGNHGKNPQTLETKSLPRFREA
jgi:hypothetical protein